MRIELPPGSLKPRGARTATTKRFRPSPSSGTICRRSGAQSLKLTGIELAVPNRVLQALMAHEGGSGLEVCPTDHIEPTRMAQHVWVGLQSSEFGWQFQPVEHAPERGWLHPEHSVGRAQPWRAQRPQEALV